MTPNDPDRVRPDRPGSLASTASARHGEYIARHAARGTASTARRTAAAPRDIPPHRQPPTPKSRRLAAGTRVNVLTFEGHTLRGTVKAATIVLRSSATLVYGVSLQGVGTIAVPACSVRPERP